MSHVAPPALPNQKKGLSCVAIGGIGCLVLVVAAFLGGGAVVARFFPQIKAFIKDAEKDPALATAMLALKVNPDIEMVTADDSKREVTFKVKSSGETMTVSFDELAQGKLKMTNAKGEEISFDASDVERSGVVMKGPDGEAVIGAGKAAPPPAWVPMYPGAVVQEGGMRVERPDGAINGLAVAKTRDSVEAVQRFFETQLKEGGFEVTITSVVEGKTAGISADKDDGKTTVGVTVTADESGEVQLVVTYQQAAGE
jgi:hypothetical protein